MQLPRLHLHERRDPRRRSLLRRGVRERVRVRAGGRGERSARSLERGGRRGSQDVGARRVQILKSGFDQDVSDAHLGQRVRATGVDALRGGHARARSLQREPGPGRVTPPGHGGERVPVFDPVASLADGTDGAHERPLVKERQHLAVDVLALLLTGRREDQGPVE